MITDNFEITFDTDIDDDVVDQRDDLSDDAIDQLLRALDEIIADMPDGPPDRDVEKSLVPLDELLAEMQRAEAEARIDPETEKYVRERLARASSMTRHLERLARVAARKSGGMQYDRQ